MNAIKSIGRTRKPAKEQIQLLMKLQQFRLVPKQFDTLVISMRDMMKRVRQQERSIQKKIVVDYASFQKKVFKSFSGHGHQDSWLVKALSSKHGSLAQYSHRFISLLLQS